VEALWIWDCSIRNVTLAM